MDRRLLPELLRLPAGSPGARRIAPLAAAILLGLAACTGGEPGAPDGPTDRVTGASVTSVGPREAVAVWPEDTRDELLSHVALVEAGADPWRLDPAQTAAAFADLVLAWPDAVTGEPEGDGTVRIEVGREEGGPAVVLTLAQVAEPLWSVIAVAGAVDPVYPPFSIIDGVATFHVGVPSGRSATVTLGYGLRTATRFLTSSGRLRIDLGGEPTTGGHLLVLYLDERQEIVSASGTALPAGDTAAG